MAVMNKITTNFRNYINSLPSTNLTEKQVYELVKTRFSYNFLPNSKITNYQNINKKIISNSYNDLVVMNQICYDLCVQNTKIYKNWLQTFCEPDFKYLLEYLRSNKFNNGKIDISSLEKILLPTCDVSNLKLSSIVDNGAINVDANVGQSVAILTKILKDSQNIKIQTQEEAKRKEEEEEEEEAKRKEDNSKKPNSQTQYKYSKEYCIITKEFCKNIKQVWSMLPSNDINLKDYNSSIKNITMKKLTPKYTLSNNSSYSELILLVNKLFNI